MARRPDPNLGPKLYDAALDVFAERGLVATRIEDVTARAGVSKGSFYLCFASKEALYHQIADDFLDAMLTRMAQIAGELNGLGAHCGDRGDAIAVADTAFLAFLSDHRRALAVVLHSARGPGTAHLFERFLTSSMAHFRETVRAHHAALPAGVPTLDPEFVARMATGLLYMLARDAVAGAMVPDIAQQLTAFRLILEAGVLSLAGQPAGQVNLAVAAMARAANCAGEPTAQESTP